MTGFSFVFLSDALCGPLWFNVLDFTTKVLKGLHKGHKGLFQQPQMYQARPLRLPGRRG